MDKEKLVIIFGPTAVGKTKFAAKLAGKFNGEIISADSRQVYKNMDIGTGKDLDDYIINGAQVPYHLIDIAEPTEEYNLARFIEDYNKALISISERGKTPFLVGGTMLYIHAILKKYKLKKVSFSQSKIEELRKLPLENLRKLLSETNAALHNTTDLNDKERLIKALIVASENSEEEITPLPTDSLNICVLPERKIIYDKIERRLEERLASGMIEETEKLLAEGVSKEKLEFFGLEYKYVSKYVLGELNYNDMKQKLASSIKKFAKRQTSWIRKIEKEGFPLHYVTSDDYEKASELISDFLSHD